MADPTGPAPKIVWPTQFIRPPAKPPVVYLDLHAWIGMAKAEIGHPDGQRHQKLLRSCRGAQARRRAQFVLSDKHYIEMGNILDPRQRQGIAALMEELTGFTTLLSGPAIMRLELQAAIDNAFGPSPRRYAPVELLGFGVSHAFGRSQRLTIHDEHGADITQAFMATEKGQRFSARAAKELRKMERHVLAGPTDDELPNVRELGFDPDMLRTIADERLEQELYLFRHLKTEQEPWRTGRLRDAVAARELTIEYLDMLAEQLLPRGLTVADLAGTQDQRSAMRSFTRCMPHAEVAIELKTQYHRTRDKVWTTNDIHDIDALAVAVPYCNVVYTDKSARHALVTAKLDKRMRGVLPRTPDDFSALLDADQ